MTLTPETQRETRRGMVPKEEWAETLVHKASSYSCAKCGEGFDSPDEVYDHLEAEHGDG